MARSGAAGRLRQQLQRLRRPAAILATLAALQACLPVTAPRHPPLPAPPSQPATTGPAASAASTALAQRYAALQETLLSRGLLRTDGGGADAPFTPQTAVTAFRRIAFYEEYDRAQGGVIRDEAPIRLARWQDPIRYSLRFSPDIPPDRVATDSARAASYLARMAALTGVTVIRNEIAPNFVIQVSSIDDRRAMGGRLAAAMPNLSEAQIRAVTAMDRDTYCLVWTEVDRLASSYRRAFVFIPAEHPDLLRLSCLHEEIAQAMGLPNDSPRARPSIFNDDEEFALLTRLDEVLLRMAYAPELRPGMSEAEALPLLLPLARRLTGGES